MLIRYITIMAICLASTLQAFAQNPVADGMNSLGLGDTTVWAAATNPSCLVASSGVLIGISANSNALCPELNQYSLVASMPAKGTDICADAHHQGYSVWQETSMGFAVSRKLYEGILAAGKLSYIHISHGTEADANSLIMPELFITAEISEYARIYGQILPTSQLYKNRYQPRKGNISLGTEYRFSPAFTGSSDVSMEHNKHIRVSVGIEYSFLRMASLRLGIANDEWPIAAGISAGSKSVWLDLSCKYHRYMGTGFSCGFRISI